MRLKTLLLAGITAILLFSRVGHASSHIDSNREIQTLLEESIEKNQTPGAALALIDQGKIKFFCAGKMAIEGQPVTQDTIFEIGSITKVFTTLILMDMVEKNEVELDDPIEIYLPGVKLPELNGKKITLRHLATHTSGLPRIPDNFDPQDLNNPYQDYTTERLYDYLKSSTLSNVPGEGFEYSNLGVGLLGHILSVHSQKSYEELLHSLFVDSSEIPNTSIAISDGMALHFSCGHELSQEVAHWDIAPPLAGAGALRSNIKDMATFLALNLGEIKSSLNPTLKKCHEKQATATPDADFGLGWVLSKSNGNELIWHNGQTGGFRSFLGFNPNTQKGVVILSNSTEEWPDSFAFTLLNGANDL